MEPWSNPTNKTSDLLTRAVKDPLMSGMVIHFLKEFHKLKSSDLKSRKLEEIYSNWVNDTKILLNNFHSTVISYELEKIIAKINAPLCDIEFIKFSHNDKSKKKIDPNSSALSGKLKITFVAEHYNLEQNRSGNWCCPFHDSKNKNSLSLNDEMNVFNCFSCDAKGDVVTFIRMLEDIKNA